MNLAKSLLITLGIAVMFSTPLQAQDDTKARKILENSKTTFDNLKDFSADFVYSLENPTQRGSSVSKEGKLYYSNGKYAIIMDEQEIYCNLETMWVHLPEDEEVSIMEYDPEEGFDIESIFNLYETNAKARYDGVETVNGSSAHKIYMAVTDKELEFNQVNLWVNQKTNLLEKAVTTNRLQTKTTYKFQGIKTNQNLPDSRFEFDTNNFGGDVYDER